MRTILSDWLSARLIHAFPLAQVRHNYPSREVSEVLETVVANQDTLPNGTQVVFHAAGAGALPAELAEGVDYFLREAGVNQYTIFASAADAVADNDAIAITDDGSGTITAYILN